MNNKQTAISFLQTVALKDVKEGYDKYVASDFKHHNQYFKGDRNSLLVAMEEASKTHPNKSFTVKFAIEEGDKVAVYSNVTQEKMDIAVVHMFRFEDGKIVEMWDVGQVIDPNSPNENGMF